MAASTPSARSVDSLGFDPDALRAKYREERDRASSTAAGRSSSMS